MILFSTTAVLVMLSALMPRDTFFKNRYISRVIIFLMFGIMVAYIPTWNVYVSDMVRYVDAFQSMSSLTLSEILRFWEWEPLFLVTQWFISRFTESKLIYVLFTFTLFFVLLLHATKRIFVPWQRMFFIFLYLTFPFYYMYVFDGIRQGIAMLLLILAITYWYDEDKKRIKFIVCIVAAGLFHDTAFIMGAIILIITLFKLRFKPLLFIWVVTAILYMTGLNENLLNFGFIQKMEYVQIYSDPDRIDRFGGANKLDFFVFTAFFIFVGLLLYRYIKLDEGKKHFYSFILKCYIGFSSAYLLFGFVAFSNRIAMYSWFLIPLVVAYPILFKEKHSSALLFLIVFVSFIASFIYSPFLSFEY